MVVEPRAPLQSTTAMRHGALLAIAVIVVAGFALTMLVFYPGYMTNDATFIYQYTKEHRYGDWQSPLMTILWEFVDPIAPGAASMFLLVATLYWLGFAVVALTIARRSPWLGMTAMLLAFTPTAFVFLVMIWRDMVFAVIWLMAAAIIFAATEHDTRLRWLASILALALVAFGLLLRPNALFAAPLLAAYVVFPTRFDWKRAAILFVPALVAGFALVQIVYYGILDAKRETPLHQIFVFDLGGITHFTGENQFPVTWSDAETALLTTKCYNPDRWDSYWTTEPCLFVMKRLDKDGEAVFGTPRLREVWQRAVIAHPLAYLSHRATYMWNLLAGSTLTLELYDLNTPGRSVLAQNRYFLRMLALHDALKPTLLFRLGFWLLLAVAACAFAWRARATPAGAFVIGTAGSAVIYVMTLLPVGIAGDFRYGYWCVLASLVGSVAAVQARCVQRSRISL
jgi:hypothetical protein